MSILFILIVATALGSYASSTEYKEAYFDQKIDHFNFRSLGSQTYKQRYLYNDTWWERKRGPIFFYAGNEASIVSGWKHYGFIMDIAPSFRAFILFVEHRYYGKSFPFGDASFDSSKIGWLSIEQALADYAFFLEAFKKQFDAQNCPVIAFGGSYGGMLSAYMRFKFPNIIQGSIASSAPVYQTAGKTSGDLFFQAVTKSFRDISSNCESQVRIGFQQLALLASSSNSGFEQISEIFRLCEPLKSSSDYEHFLRWIRNAFVVTTMIVYPFSRGNFPAFPVKEICKRIEENSDPSSDLLSACDLYYNASGNSECFDIYEEYIYCADPTGCTTGPVSTAWDYQACTEVNLEGGSNGVTDMFPVLPFNSTMRDEHCRKTWNVTPRRNWLDVLYWGEDISLSSNIIFSNGDLDPWTPGGVLKNISDSILAILIEGGAHNLDLWSYQPEDPQSVIDARNFEMRNIEKWIREYHEANNKE